MATRTNASRSCSDTPETTVARGIASQKALDPAQGREAILSLRGFDLMLYRFSAGHRLPVHEHEDPTLVLLLEGSYVGHQRRRRLSSRPRSRFTEDEEVRTGEVAIVPEHRPHQEEIGDRGAYGLLVRPRWEHLQSLPKIAPLFEDFRCFRDREVRRIGQRIREEIARSDPLTPLALEGALLELVSYLARSEPRPELGAASPQFSEKVRSLLDESFPELPSLTWLAAEVGVSRSRLVRGFRATYGCSVGDYVRRRRLESAAEAIRRDDASLGQIALQNGFYDQSHFTNAFREHFGSTPAAYRLSLP